MAAALHCSANTFTLLGLCAFWKKYWGGRHSRSPVAA